MRNPRSAARPFAPLCATLVIFCLAAGCSPNSTEETVGKAAVPKDAAPEAAAPTAETEKKSAKKLAGTEKLTGRWVRTDTPYVIEIRHVADDGSLDASYLNPNPINVGRAEARQKGDALEVFVELDDVNYPGSSYTLSYDTANDALVGVYFQAVAQQEYQIAFVRAPSGE